MGLVIAVVVICLVILFREEIRSGLGRVGRSLVIAVPMLAVLWWAGQPIEWRFLLGVAIVATVLERTWSWATGRRQGRRQSGAFREELELPNLSPEARLRRQYERGMITDEEFVRRWTEIHGQAPLRLPGQGNKRLGNR